MSESTTAHHETQGKSEKKNFLSGNGKWYLLGGLGVIAVLVFLFVKQSNANSSSGTSATGTTLDPTTEAMLQQALQNQAGSAAYVVPPSSNTGTTTTSSTPTTTVPTTGINTWLPAGNLGWEEVNFPTQAALNQFTQWTGSTPNITRTAYNNEITSLGGSGVNGALVGPTQGTGNPLDAQ